MFGSPVFVFRETLVFLTLVFLTDLLYEFLILEITQDNNEENSFPERFHTLLSFSSFFSKLKSNSLVQDKESEGFERSIVSQRIPAK